jgi:uncharacterized protein YjbJ (UPF0337 family)
MGLGDKVRNKADQASGKAKEAVGKITGDTRLEVEGRLQQGRAGLSEGAGKLKDGMSDAAEHIKDAFKQ